MKIRNLSLKPKTETLFNGTAAAPINVPDSAYSKWKRIAMVMVKAMILFAALTGQHAMSA